MISAICAAVSGGVAVFFALEGASGLAAINAAFCICNTVMAIANKQT